jgi:hypothetical protein
MDSESRGAPDGRAGHPHPVEFYTVITDAGNHSYDRIFPIFPNVRVGGADVELRFRPDADVLS